MKVIYRITYPNGKIYVGQRLVIPGQPRPVAEDGTTAYVVLAGDSLFAIAQRYGRSWEELADLNRLVSPNALYVGQVIRVPVAGLVGGAQIEDSPAGIRAAARAGMRLRPTWMTISGWAIAF